MKKLNNTPQIFLLLCIVFAAHPFYAQRDDALISDTIVEPRSSSDSQKLQALLDAIPASGGTITIPDGMYTIDEVLKINDRQNLTINFSKYTTLISKKHGHGILEIGNSRNITIQGGTFSGAGNFLDKNHDDGIGGGEKVYTLNQKVNWGHHRNGALKKIGAYNNGYIGNSGIGILIYDGSEDITIKNTEVQFFNYSGIQIQFIGHPKALQENYCSNIRIENNNIHDIYSAGISAHGFKDSTITDNIIYNIGHPDTNGTETQVNPGYGITMRGVSRENTHANNITISNNGIRNCKRAGIDAHSGTDLFIVNNTIDNAYIAGISVVGKSGARDAVIISENTITNCGNVTGGEGLDAKTAIRNTYPNSIIEKNVIRDSGYDFAIYNKGSNTIIKQNAIYYYSRTSNVFTRGICVIGNESEAITQNEIIGNTIKGDIASAIYIVDALNCRVIENRAALINRDEILKIVASKKIKKRRNKWR